METNKAALGGAAAAILGSFLAWYQLQTIFGTIELTGWDGDGKITAVCAAAAAWSAVKGDRRARILGGIAATVAFVTGGAAFTRLSDVEADNEYARGSVGVGLYLVLLGSLIAAASLLFDKDDADEQATAPVPG